MTDTSVSSSELPLVSLVLPMRNEEQFIARCLDSVFAGDYPKDRLEILVLDGMSEDASGAIVERYIRRAEKLGGPSVRLIANPRKIAPTALNIGIREARGEIIVRMDTHTLYAPDYVSRCVELLRTTGAANVGGPQTSVGTDYLSNAIAVATTHPVAAGNAKFRTSDRGRRFEGQEAFRETWVDTVYLGAWRKETLVRLGGFNEAWVTNQDYELNVRIRKAGGKILLSTRIRCEYFVRSSLKKLARQYFRYGWGRVRTLNAHPDSLRVRQLVPPVFVLAAFLSLLAAPFAPLVPAALFSFYFLTLLAGSIHAASRSGWRYLPALPLIFVILHFSWGLGFWKGVKEFGLPYGRPSR